jgi:hypothetical protein
MKSRARQHVLIWGFVTVGVVLIIAGFLRGYYLEGSAVGIVNVAIMVCILWLLARSVLLIEKPSIWRVVLIPVASIPLGVLIAYPASIFPDTRVAIAMHETDRATRAELATVFGSDSAFRNLSISTEELRALNLTIHGSLKVRSDLDRLRDRIVNECNAVHRCILHWEVIIENPTQQIHGLDSELFDKAAEPPHSKRMLN